MLTSDTFQQEPLWVGRSDSQDFRAARLEYGRSSLRSMPCSERKNCQRELGLADVVADAWHPGWPSQPLIARRAIRGSPNRKLRVLPFATENPTTCLRGNPTVETRSQPAPMSLSNAYSVSYTHLTLPTIYSV